MRNPAYIEKINDYSKVPTWTLFCNRFHSLTETFYSYLGKTWGFMKTQGFHPSQIGVHISVFNEVLLQLKLH